MTTISAATTTPTSAASQAGNQLNVDYQNFLKLLTAQISNQDPLAPMESTEFVSQLAQLSQVEQSIQTNANLEAISAAMSSTAARGDLGFLGRDVMVPGTGVTLDDDGAALGYELGAEAASVSVTIHDASGAITRSFTGESTAGVRHRIDWDGTGNDGIRGINGTYSVQIAAYDAEGNPVTASTFVESKVTAVGFEDGTTVLDLANGSSAIAAQVVAVR